MMRRSIGLVVGGAAIAVSLSGCLLPLDAAPSEVWYINNYDQPVTVLLEGEPAFDVFIKSPGSLQLGIDDCTGTAIRVETEDGEILGRVVEPACPGGKLTINKDGTLDYVKDE